MLQLVRDLFGHQAWADAEMWRLLGSTAAAQSDPRIIELLNHIHAVQRFFLSAVEGQPLTREELLEQIPLPKLRESYERYHSKAEGYLAKMRESHLEDRVTVPWFPDFQPTCQEALVQAATHSIHHRAQIATLIRQHGGRPEATDYIIGTSKQRPAPQWEASAASAGY